MVQVILEVLRESVIGKTLDVHVAILFDNNAATDMLSQELQTLSSFMAPIATFVQRKTNTTIVDRNLVITKASEMETMTAKEDYGKVIEKRPGSS